MDDSLLLQISVLIGKEVGPVLWSAWFIEIGVELNVAIDQDVSCLARPSKDLSKSAGLNGPDSAVIEVKPMSRLPVRMQCGVGAFFREQEALLLSRRLLLRLEGLLLL